MFSCAILAIGFAPRAPPPRMGGLTGLPRIDDRALKLTRPWNPGCVYTEPIATLWRDLETLFGEEDSAGLGGSRTRRDSARLADSGVSTNKFRGFTRDVDLRAETVLKAVRKEPSLLNPAVSNRFTFARSKACLAATLGSQRAAIEVMIADPSILKMGDELEDVSAGQIKARVLGKQLGAALPPLLLLGLLGYGALTLPADGGLALPELPALPTLG